jgi:hypothetical protein
VISVMCVLMLALSTLVSAYRWTQHLRFWLSVVPRAYVEAKMDLAQDTPKHKIYGELRSEDEARAEDAFAARHGVTVERVAGCVVTADLALHVEVYNAVINQGVGLPQRAWETRRDP